VFVVDIPLRIHLLPNLLPIPDFIFAFKKGIFVSPVQDLLVVLFVQGKKKDRKKETSHELHNR